MQDLIKEKPMYTKFFVLVLIVILCAIIGSGLLVVMSAFGGLELQADMDVFLAVNDPQMRPYIKTGIGLNHMAMFALSACVFAYWLLKEKWLTYFHLESIDSDLLMKFVLLLFLSYPLIGLSAMALEYVNLPDWANSIDEASVDSLMNLLQMDGIGDLIINLIIIALIPAIGEELLFRGVIQNELVKKMINPHVAILIASIIFSGFHLQVQGFLPKLIIGVILGYAYFWTRSLWYPMILHFINNGLQTLILYFSADQLTMAEESAETPEISQLVIVVIISCFLCYFLIKNIIEQTGRKETKAYDQIIK